MQKNPIQNKNILPNVVENLLDKVIHSYFDHDFTGITVNTALED